MAGSSSRADSLTEDEESVEELSSFTGFQKSKEKLEPESENIEEEEADFFDKLGKLEEDEEDDPPFLTRNPRFDVVFRPSHVERTFVLNMPKKMRWRLPRAPMRSVIRCKNKTWDLFYRGHYSTPRFEGSGWRSFVADNRLRIGDACVFELMTCNETLLEFKVQILRHDLPPELAAYLSNTGESEENPIGIT